jgi:hypothetical protein
MIRVLWSLLFAALSAAGLAGTARSQGCAARTVYTAPAYHEPYSGHRDGYRYDHEHHEYVKIFVATPLVVPVAVPSTAFINLSPPSSPPTATFSPSFVQERERQAAAAKDELTRRLDRIERALTAQAQSRARVADDDGDLPPAANDGGGRVGRSAPKRERPDESGQPNQPPPFDAAAVGILQARCAQCHTGTASRGDVQIFNDAGGFELAGATRGDLWKQIKRDAMPRGPVKCTADEKRVIQAWSESD